MSAEDLKLENVVISTAKDKTMHVEVLSTKLNKLVRNTEEVKADIFENLEKMYQTFVLMFVDVEYFKDKLLKLSKELEVVRDCSEKLPKGYKDIKGRLVNFEDKLNRVKLLLMCCDWLLEMYEEMEGLRTSNGADAYSDAVRRYMSIKDLGNNIFNSFASDELALKEFGIVVDMDRRANVVVADLIVKMKKKFFENIMWTKDLVETKLTIKCFTVESPNLWTEILDSLHKMGRLERLLTQLFNDLMTHFFRPIMNSAYLRYSMSSNRVILSQDLLHKSKFGRKPKLFTERIRSFVSLIDFILKNMKSPHHEDEVSLIERFGSGGRGRALFEFLIGCLSPDRAGLNPEECRPFIDTIKMFLIDFTRKKFLRDNEAAVLHTRLDSLTSEPSLYPILVNRASKLVQENIRFGVRVGSKIVGDEDGDDDNLGWGDDDVGGGDEGSNTPISFSPFKGLFARYEEMMPDLVKFKECCVSMSGSRMIDIFYEAMEVKILNHQPVLNLTLQNSSYTFMDSTMNITNSTFNLGSESSGTKGQAPKVGTIMKKCSEVEVLGTWRCVRLVAELFIECVPAIHKQDINEDAVTAALHHNDCMYMAHHLTFLEHHLRPEEERQKSKKGQPKLPPIVHPNLPMGLTSYDLQYDLKKLASKSLVTFLLRKQVELVDILKTSFEEMDPKGSTKDAFKKQLNVLVDVRNKIFKLKKVWNGILQKEVLNNALGILISKIIDTAIDQFTEQASQFIPRRQANKTGSADDKKRKQLLGHVSATLNYISDKLVMPLYSLPSLSSAKVDRFLSKVISNWKKLKEVCFITEPHLSHVIMTKRWCVKDGRRGGGLVFDKNVVGEILTHHEARAFLSLVFEGEERDNSLKLFK